MAPTINLSGGQLNTATQGSLGGQRSDTIVVTDVNENFFDDITRAEGLIGKTEYRMGYIYNPDATTYAGITIQLTTNPNLGQVSIGLDPVGKGDGRNTGIGTTIATEDATPASVKFFGEENVDDGAYDTVIIPIGTLKQGEGVPFWLKRKTEQGTTQVITFNFVIEYFAPTFPGETFDDGGAMGELLKIDIASAPYVVDTARVEFSEVG
jgi:hypothetical protein